MTSDLWILHISIMVMLIIVAIMILRVRRLMAAIFLFGIFSLLMAMIYLLLAAPDVAMTEAAVGAGVSTVFLLAALSGLKRFEVSHHRHVIEHMVVAGAFFAAMIYAFTDLPVPGSVDNPANQNVSAYYLQHTQSEIGTPNVVTAVLASYRGYDTLGELFVIFTAATGVAAISRRGKKDA